MTPPVSFRSFVTRRAPLIALALTAGCVGVTGPDDGAGDGDGDGVAGVGGYAQGVGPSGGYTGDPNALTGGALLGAGGGAVLGSGGDQGPGSGGTAFVPVDCSGISNAGYELCDSTETTCGAVFTESEGCSAVCEAAGLTCMGAFENLADACGADETRPAVPCDSGHQSDYCLCVGDGSPPVGAGGAFGAGGASSGGASSGGATSGGASSGGASSGGASSGGTSSGGASSGGSSSGGSPNIGPAQCGCEDDAGEFGTVSSTIVVKSGQVYDGKCKIFRADPDDLGDGSQAEGQKPVFKVEDGGTLKNVILGASAADGVHTYGDVTLQNVHWLDVGEDAMTVKESGTVRVECGSAFKGSDKIFQINAYAELHISNFTANGAGKFIRELGGDDFDIDVYIDHCDISSMSEAIFRTDSDSSHVTMTNTRYKNIGDALFIFGDDEVNGNSSQSSVSNNQSY